MEVKGLRSEVIEVVLRLRPRNFRIIPESLAANLEKVRQTSVSQTGPEFRFICLFLFFLKDLLLQVLQKEKYQSQINQNFGTI